MGIADGKVIGTTRILNYGSSVRRWDLVLVAEGYTLSQLPQFALDAQQFVTELLATAPFDSLRTAINVSRIDVASNQSGADDPSTCGGTGLKVNTYFDASFCNNGIHRLLIVNNTTVKAVVTAAVPTWDQIVVIVNTAIAGGSGSPSIAVTSKAATDPSKTWPIMTIHELGHSAFALADEYGTYAGCGVAEPGRNMYTGNEPAEKNVTTDTNKATIKWRNLIASATPLPTTWPGFPGPLNASKCVACEGGVTSSPVPAGTVGAFVGAYSYHCGVYRPEFECMMRNYTKFCAVCRRVIRDRLAQHLFGGCELFRATNWSLGWTSFAPFELPGSAQPHYLAYKALTGDVTIDRINAGGIGVTTVWGTPLTPGIRWSTGWTHFTPFKLGGQPHYLAYKALTGDVTIDRINPAAQGVMTVWGTPLTPGLKWSTGWTHFVPFELGGHPHYLAYNATTGAVTIDRINPAAQGVTTVWGTPLTPSIKWSLGWTSFVPFRLGGQPHYLAYKFATGDVTIDRIRPDGKGVDTVWGTPLTPSIKWSPGWTHFVPFEMEGLPHHLVYNAGFGPGELYIDRIRPSGEGVDAPYHDFMASGWTSFAPFMLNGDPIFLAYNATAGLATIRRF